MNKIDTIVIAVGGQGRRVNKDLIKRGIKTSKVFLEFKGKPLLNYLIDMSLDMNFQRIYLLSSYFERELCSYLKKNYVNNSRIIPIYGGKKGREWGVPWLLHSIKSKLHKQFIYSDGNILYNPSILKKITSKDILKLAHANIVLSNKDIAPTHLRVIIYKKRIIEINVRLPLLNIDKTNHIVGKQYYGLGLMALDGKIFSAIPGFAYKRDLDCVINDIFRLHRGLVRGTVYQGSWHAIHTIKDVDKLAINS